MAFDRNIIDEFERGATQLEQSVAGLSREDLLAFPVAGTWSIQQIVIHLADSDLIGVDRMKRIIAEENPLLIGYNETLFANKLHYEAQSSADAVTLFKVNRIQFAKVLRLLPDETFDRTGIHNEAGKVSLGTQLKKYNEHLAHHLRFITEKRRLLKK